jgi:hypothetical protein
MAWNRNRIDHLSYRLLRQAHRELAADQTDKLARQRFNAWCRAAGRCLGMRAPLAAVEYEGLKLRSS